MALKWQNDAPSLKMSKALDKEIGWGAHRGTVPACHVVLERDGVVHFKLDVIPHEDLVQGEWAGGLGSRHP